MAPSRVHRRSALAGLAAAGAAACSRASGAAGSAAVGDDFSLGSPTAKRTVVEYASVGCPVCGQWAREVFPAFKAKWVDTGRVRYTYREMLVGGGVELTAAAAGFVLARCAGAGKYWPVVEAIYREQDRLFQAPRPTLLDIARGAGMTEDRFTACMNDDAAFTAMNARSERNTARDGGIEATPTFIVDGKKLAAGFHTLAEIEAALG